MKKLVVLFLLSIYTLLLSAQNTCDYVMDSKLMQNGDLLELSNAWRFKPGDNAQWKNSDFNDSNWHLLKSTNSEEKFNQEFKEAGFNNIGWFRTTICIDSLSSNKPLALMLSNDAAMEIYWDGNRVGGLGKNIGEENVVYQKQRLPMIFNSGEPGSHVLAVKYHNKRAYKNDEFSENGFRVGIQNATIAFDTIHSNSFSHNLLSLGVGSVFATIFVIHLLIFLMNRKDKSNLYFAIFSLSISTLLLTLFFNRNVQNIAVAEAFVITVGICMIIATFSLSLLLNYLFGSFGLTFKLIIALICCSVLLGIWDSNSDLFSYTLLAAVTLTILESIYLISRAIVRKVPGSKIIGFGLLFFLLTLLVLLILIVVLKNVSLSTSDPLTGFIFIVFLFVFILSIPISISAYLAWKVASVNRNLALQVKTTNELAQEKQQILADQNEKLEKEVAIRTEEIVTEKKKSDDLLLNILPSEIAEELKVKGQSKAQKYDRVSVLFTDFVSFTKISEQVGVDELLNELNYYFTEFDKIMEENNLEKIKTIGDAYLAVSGLPVSNENHAKNTVNAALQILDLVEKRKTQTPYPMNIRIGINSGSLIAGIIGVKKFAYDIWGDTVNTAARMEQSSESGKINISENTYQLVKDDFLCQHRGKISAKGKGEMDMYFVVKKA